MPIHHLHEPIDVFSEWLDDCERAQQGNNPNDEPEEIEEEEDDDLGETSGLGHPRTGQAEAARKEPEQPPSAAHQRQSYTDLGLDDSDDDSEDD